jgi:murein DD-endopeptidase MepM/ murein hydrolase activator NlpD
MLNDLIRMRTLNSLSTRHRSESGGVVFGLFLLITAVSILGGGLFAFIKLTHTDPLSPSFLEDVPPAISWHDLPRGLGAEAVTIGLNATDNSSGLDEVVVRILQNNLPQELTRKTFGTEKTLNETIEVTVNPKELDLKEGNAELQVLAFDKSLWNNGARLSAVVEVNYLKPQITALTPQQNGVLGGTEMVFYKVTGKPPEAHGVLGQGSLFNGFPAAGWIDNLKGRPSLYLAIYPISPSFDESRETLKLIARDNLGNSATGSFNYRIKQRRWSSFRTTLNYERAKQLRDGFYSYAKRENLNIKESGELVIDIKSIIKALSLSDEGFVGTALEQSASTRSWREAFLTPVNATPTNSAGDTRVVYIEDKELVRGVSSGVRFPVSRRTPVIAANRGTVVFIGTLGLLGNTVIIDHGFGLSSLYAHLSDVGVQRGVTVERGQEIAKTGLTGLAQSEEVYFEIRVHGVPVSPNEWWDQSWVTDHIDNKVNFVVREAN